MYIAKKTNKVIHETPESKELERQASALLRQANLRYKSERPAKHGLIKKLQSIGLYTEGVSYTHKEAVDMIDRYYINKNLGVHNR